MKKGRKLVIGLRIVDQIAAQDWLDKLSGGVQKVVQSTLKAGGAAGKQIEDVLHGTLLGHPLHPLLTDIPIGAWTVAAAFDLLDTLRDHDDLAPGADAAIAIGLLGAVGAASSGLADWKELDSRPLRVGMLHGMLNLGATALYAASLLLRRNQAREAGKLCAFAGYALVAAAGYLGGDLVFRDQIGVSHAEPVWERMKFKQVLKADELAEGELRQVEVGNRTILLARQNGTVYAMENSCSHLGGPLSEGRLLEGCVECPWQGSRFALTDGSAIAGPASLPQPSFEARVRSGQIEVRAG
jgi:nitrite reductase/ring-hydroxylating ferredoxin subunit/uncharacterized membrane protein